MKRQRSSDDIDSYNEKSSSIKDTSQSRSSSRSFYYKSDNVRRGGGLMSPSLSSSRYERDRFMDEDISNRESSWPARKRPDYGFDGFDPRKGLGFDRYGSGRGSGGGHSRGECYGGGNRSIHRSESFCGSRREFPKGFRSERERSRREGSLSSWRRFGNRNKELEETRGAGRSGDEERISGSAATACSTSRSSSKGLRDVKSPTRSKDSGSEQTRAVRGGARDEGKGRVLNSKARSSPTWSKDSGSEQSKSMEVGKKSVELEAGRSAEAEAVGSGEVELERRCEVEVGKSAEIELGRRNSEVEVGKSAEIELGRRNSEVELGKSSEMELGKSSEMELGRKNSEVEVGKSAEIELGRRNSEVEVGKGAEMELGRKNSEVEVGKSAGLEEVKSRASGKGNEMEEGELEPDPETIPRFNKAENNDAREGPKGVDCGEVEGGTQDCSEVQGECQVKDQVREEEKELQKELVPKGQDAKEVEKRPSFEENMNDSAAIGLNDAEKDGACVGAMEVESLKERYVCKEEKGEDMIMEKSTLEGKSSRDDQIDLVVKAENVEVTESSKEVRVENKGAEVNVETVTESLTQDLKDKGKNVAVSPALVIDSAENDAWNEGEPRNGATYRDREDDMEGPSVRGFELFGSSPVRRVDKAEQSAGRKQIDEKLAFEPLDLSLGLPNVLSPIGATRDKTQGPGSPSHGRSIQSFSSFRTDSDAFTASISFSGSQSFFHNPSCSLTQNSLDMENFEQSVHSRPIFGGVDHPVWQAQDQNDSKTRDVFSCQRILMNGNETCHQSQAILGMPNSQPMQETSKMSNKLERQLSFHKQLSGDPARNHDDTRSSSQSVGSHDIGSTYIFEKKQATREKSGGILYRSNSQKKREQLLIGGADYVETIIGRIVSDPVHITAKRFHEMTGQSASCLKESIHEIMLKVDKQGQLRAFQTVLRNRSDLKLDMLLKAHRCQLEILVALKTGLPVYLNLDNNICSSNLAEIFMNLRCRNLTCQNVLPVDECDCKICVKKDGFCSACMCLVCSKFDMASNTCCWVGCDVCLHWCHVDCALQESYIRSESSPSGTKETTETQFHCVACNNSSEMFGFVKEVFQNFAKNWTAGQFCKELEYVKRIFCASKDERGRRLHEISDLMLANLANECNLHEVYSRITGFLTESDSSKFAKVSASSGRGQENGSKEATAGPSQDTLWFKSLNKENTLPLETSATLSHGFLSNLNGKRPMDSELQGTAQKEPHFDELESIVRIKLAEARMFQARADDARREAEGLKRIATAKNEKIEEEYTCRLAKLRIVDVEEKRRQKFEEFQALKRTHQEYLNMKTRMDSDLKDLLLKMEATKNITLCPPPPRD